MSMVKRLFPSFALILGMVIPAQAQERSPIIYNLKGYEVGVILDMKPNGDALVLPTKGTLDLGYYNVVIPGAALRPRSRGGWQTNLRDQDIAFLPPVTPRFFMPSGI